MNGYGKAALRAVQLYANGQATSPGDAWSVATAKIFGGGTSSQKKACPRETFLGLCQKGLVKGIPRGSYTGSKMNMQYGVDAVDILKRNPELAAEPGTLWNQVLRGESKTHNQQMNVVVSLWSEGLIK